MAVLKKIFLYLFAVLFIIAGGMHFISPEFYLRIMPPYIPFHELLVYLTGVIEIVLGILIFFPKTRKVASWAIIGLLIAFLPVHIYMVMNPVLFADLAPEIGLWIRFPIQGLLIAWAWWIGKRNKEA